MDKDYLVKAKVNGQFRTFGNVKKNKFNNYAIGLRMTPELRKLLSEVQDGSWVNLSMFEDSGERKPAPVMDDDLL